MASNRAVSGKYVGTDPAELATLRAQYVAARTGILTGGQAYSRPGFSFTKADLATINDEIAEISYAQSIASGTLVTRQVVDFRE